MKIYEAPPDADINAIETWRLANPSLGIIKSEKTMRADLDNAKGSPALLADWRVYHLNQWIEQSENTFVNIADWDACFDAETDKIIEATAGQREIVAGVDISTKVDLTAITLLFAPCDADKCYRLKSWSFKPTGLVDDHSARDNFDYRLAAKQGALILSPGEIISQQDVYKKLLELKDKYGVVKVVCDHNNMTYMMRDLAENFEVVAFGQTILNYDRPTKRFLELVLTSGIKHDNQALFRFCLRGTVVWIDGNENMRPSKKSSRSRIDPVVAALMALAIHETPNEQVDPNEIYADRGLLSVGYR